MSFKTNWRGQNINLVEISVIEGERREQIFINECEKYTDKKIIKQSKYSPFDFKIKSIRNIAIEMKSYNYAHNERKSFMIGKDKIDIFEEMMTTNNIFLIFGFYPKNINTITYKYLKITDISILKTSPFTWEKKQHYNINTSLMKDIKEFYDILNSIKLNT